MNLLQVLPLALSKGLVVITVTALCSHHAMATDCVPVKPETFTVNLPKLGAVPSSENPEGWNLPDVWEGHPGATSDSITVPNGRPIYALIISGYAINSRFDELLVYDFARHLMAQDAYVHWAWWNNLCKPYLGGPLHYSQSHPGTAADLASFATPAAAANKAVPADDYQFIADAKLLLSAIRANNPEAIIVLVGHSMGGAACARLASQTNVVIDIAAPIDPVGNRNYPWAGPAYSGDHFYNWTRWRATRGTFRGFKGEHWQPFQGGCNPVDPWFENYALALLNTDIVCNVHVHGAGAMSMGSNIINLWHRWQSEAAFPFDYDVSYNFGANPPPGGTNSQSSMAMQSVGTEQGGWPSVNLGGDCCPIGVGVGWPGDGHGEIIGTRGPAVATRALGTRVRTSPQCSGCPNTDWPVRTLTLGNWSDPNAASRIAEMKELEILPLGTSWEHEPYNPSLCKVSTGLISRFNTMNKPPIANAGSDQIVICNGCTSTSVSFNGTGSSDPESSALTYTWNWNGGSATGPTPTATLPYGPTCITLQVKDAAGHVALDYVQVIVRYPSGVTPYPNNATMWQRAAAANQSYVFDEFFPGVANAITCLLPNPNEPAILKLDGGELTVTASERGIPYCAISDSSTEPAVSDARINNANSVVAFAFDPPIRALYTYYGSLAIGHVVTMNLYNGAGDLVETIISPPSLNNSSASGMGFTSTTPIARIEFTTTEPGPVLVGAFTGLATGQQSLGTTILPGYPGPNGSSVHFDFGFSFSTACPADVSLNGLVNVEDLILVISAWGSPGGAADINGDGVVNVGDLLAIIAAWGPCP